MQEHLIYTSADATRRDGRPRTAAMRSPALIPDFSAGPGTRKTIDDLEDSIMQGKNVYVSCELGVFRDGIK